MTSTVTPPDPDPGCGIPINEPVPATSRIYGGRETCKGCIPWQVALILYTQTDGTVFCGGSILSPHYVMTAAHCFYASGKLSALIDYSVRVYFHLRN